SAFKADLEADAAYRIAQYFVERVIAAQQGTRIRNQIARSAEAMRHHHGRRGYDFEAGCFELRPGTPHVHLVRDELDASEPPRQQNFRRKPGVLAGIA